MDPRGATDEEIAEWTRGRACGTLSRMQFEITVRKLRTYVRVTISGSPALEAFLSMLHLIGVESEEWKGRPVLFDLRGVRTKFSPQEHAEIGLQVATSMLHVDRVAALVRPHRYTQVGERVGRRNGLDVRMFVDEATALVWLKDKTLVVPASMAPVPGAAASHGRTA
jgi:hypothetical protein